MSRIHSFFILNVRNLKIQTLNNENTKLNGKMKEVEEWKLKYVQLEQEFGSRGSDADAKINASKLELEKVTIIYVGLMFFVGS